jgi:hypothetical protein
MSTAAKAALAFGVSFLVGAFKAFALMLMWNWFVLPVFHTGEISFWQVLGLLWVVQLFVGDDARENPVEQSRWESLFLVVSACVPDHKDAEVKEELKQKTDGVWGQMGIHIASQLFSYAFTLGLGWLVHTFFAGA